MSSHPLGHLFPHSTAIQGEQGLKSVPVLRPLLARRVEVAPLAYATRFEGFPKEEPLSSQIPIKHTRDQAQPGGIHAGGLRPPPGVEQRVEWPRAQMVDDSGEPTVLPRRGSSDQEYKATPSHPSHLSQEASTEQPSSLRYLFPNRETAAGSSMSPSGESLLRDVPRQDVRGASLPLPFLDGSVDQPLGAEESAGLTVDRGSGADRAREIGSLPTGNKASKRVETTPEPTLPDTSQAVGPGFLTQPKLTAAGGKRRLPEIVDDAPPALPMPPAGSDGLLMSESFGVVSPANKAPEQTSAAQPTDAVMAAGAAASLTELMAVNPSPQSSQQPLVRLLPTTRGEVAAQLTPQGQAKGPATVTITIGQIEIVARERGAIPPMVGSVRFPRRHRIDPGPPFQSGRG